MKSGSRRTLPVGKGFASAANAASLSIAGASRFTDWWHTMQYDTPG
jgi:hypothetical protein